MPDSKITALTSIGASTDPANDPLVLVDVSDTSMAATGTTKKVTLNQLLGASGTATLASATISGDLTVDTSTLKVDSANNRVGIGTATPTDTLDVNGRVTAARFLSSSSSASLPALAVSAGNGVYNSGTNEVGFSVNSTLAMTLNSTGLGVGVTPSASTVRTVQSQYGVFVGNDELNVASNAYFGSSWKYVSAATAARYSQAAGVHYWFTAAAGAAANDPITTFAAANAKMTLDASGNLLVGTTSSLRNTAHSFKALGASTSYWAAAFQQDGTTSGGRCISLDLPNTNSSSSLFVYATNSSGYAFGVLGNGSLENATGSYGTISDLRLKENISDARNYLADLLKLRVVKYSLKSESSAVATKIGFIAQEVEQVFPTLVETNTEDVKSIKTTVLIPMLLKAIQELTARVEALEA